MCEALVGFNERRVESPRYRVHCYKRLASFNARFSGPSTLSAFQERSIAQKNIRCHAELMYSWIPASRRCNKRRQSAYQNTLPKCPLVASVSVTQCYQVAIVFGWSIINSLS